MVVRVTFIYFDQMFELNMGGVKLEKYNQVSLIRHLGFMS